MLESLNSSAEHQKLIFIGQLSVDSSMDSFKNSDQKSQIDLEEEAESRIPVPSSAELMREEFKEIEESDLVVIQTFNLVTLLKKASLCCPA